MLYADKAFVSVLAACMQSVKLGLSVYLNHCKDFEYCHEAQAVANIVLSILIVSSVCVNVVRAHKKANAALVSKSAIKYCDKLQVTDEGRVYGLFPPRG